tara:strand:- start:861 stop:1712 length:852 start_codon:yes stop_codon:yes gene_type:complete
MGYGDDLLITTFASKIKEQYPDRQIVIGNFEEKRAYHSIIYDNNPNIADCRNIDPNKPTHIINYHQYNRPYIDYEKSTNTKYVWRNFKPKPGQIFFTKEEKLNAKSIISQAIDYWKNTNDENYKKIIFLETSSTKKNNKQFGMKHKNKDWGYENWENLINKIKKDYLIIQSLHHETKKNIGIFTPENLDFRLACAVLNEVDFYVGPEGGFGHVAAALNKKAVLYFGGWISPDTIGYDFHENIYYDNKLSPCGEYKKICNHCEEARKAISVDIFLKHINKIGSN